VTTPIVPVGALDEEMLALGSATLYEASGLDCFLPVRLRPVWTAAAGEHRAGGQPSPAPGC
jgi:hypothetical protein